MTSSDASEPATEGGVEGATDDHRWRYLLIGLVATLISCAYQYGSATCCPPCAPRASACPPPACW